MHLRTVIFKEKGLIFGKLQLGVILIQNRIKFFVIPVVEGHHGGQRHFVIQKHLFSMHPWFPEKRMNDTGL